MNNIDLSSLLNLCIGSVYALVNDKDKKVYIGHSMNLLLTIGDLYRSNKDILVDELRLEILEECSNQFLGKLLAQYHLDKYRRSGYTSYRYREFIKAKYTMDIEKVKKLDYDKDSEVNLYSGLFTSNYRIVIRYKLCRGRSIICGIFDNKVEAREFLDNINMQIQKYPQYIVSPIFAFNIATKQYYNENKKIYNEFMMI